MKTKTIKLDAIQAIITHADLLAERHASYVSEFVTRANSELYAILAEILKLHEQVEASNQRDKLIKRMRVKLKDEHKIKTQANTTTTALVTKYVTRASRKTAHVYSRVLQVAIANGVTSAGLVAYIQQRGGIDKARMAVDSAEAIKQAMATAKSYRQQLRTQLDQKSAVGSLDLSAVKHTLPCASDVAFYHLLCRFNNATLTHEIVAVLYPSSTLKTQAMSEYLTLLDLAGESDRYQFYDKCKGLGVDMDILHRWMAANSIDSADAARQMLRALTASANQPLHSIPTVSLLKAA